MGGSQVNRGQVRSLLLAAAFVATAVAAPAPGLAAAPKGGQATLISSAIFKTNDVLAAQLGAPDPRRAGAMPATR
jgi:hypothetical protein